MSGLAVPALDLSAHHAPIKEELYDAIRRVVETNSFILGPEVALLENEVAEYCQTKHCVGVSSGTDALLIALMALDVKPGDEVITTPFTFFATVGAIARLGATPVFVDIDPVTYNLNSDLIEEAITPRTKGILPVHLYGQCAEMEKILDIAGKRNLFVLEDAAQAIGAKYQGRPAGSMGIAGCFSFFPSKNLGAFGDGGAVTTNDDGFADKLRCLRVHGSKPKYFHRVIGGNFRLDSIQAAVLRVKLRHLDRWTEARQAAAARYSNLFRSGGLAGTLVTCPQAIQERHIYNQYVLRAPRRDDLREYLSRRQIGNAIYYPVPLHLQECFKHLGYDRGAFPQSETAAKETLAIPLYPELTQSQQEVVVDAIADFYAGCGWEIEKRAA